MNQSTRGKRLIPVVAARAEQDGLDLTLRKRTIGTHSGFSYLRSIFEELSDDSLLDGLHWKVALFFLFASVLIIWTASDLASWPVLVERHRASVVAIFIVALTALSATVAVARWSKAIVIDLKLICWSVALSGFTLIVSYEAVMSGYHWLWSAMLIVLGVLVFAHSPLATAIYVAVISFGNLTYWPNLGATERVISVATPLMAYGLAWVQSKIRIQGLDRMLVSKQRAEKAQAVLASFEESGTHWLWETDSRGRLTYASDSFKRLLGCHADKIHHKNFLHILRSQMAGGDLPSDLRTIEFYLSAQLSFREISLPLQTDQGVTWVSISGGARVDERNQFNGFSGIGTDLTAARRSEDGAKKLALFDSLTKIANRSHFDTILSGLLDESRSRHAPCYLLYIDLDRFKTVNDTLGHPVGDELLKEVACRIEHVLGDRGQPGRLGGDEFAVVIPAGLGQAEVETIAERLIAELSAPYHIGHSRIAIGASIGIATGPSDGATSQELIRSADLALYAAKSAGRGVYCLYHPDMRATAEVRQGLEMDLRKALEEGQLHLMYQPVFELRTSRLTGFEALIRWDHPEHGPIKPELFVSIAEESGIICKLGEWVLRTALHSASQWPDHIKIAINLSPLQFQDAGLVTYVINALAASQVNPSRVEFEITESVFLQDIEGIHAILEKLRSMGLSLVIDDFGTGYSSLGYLRKGLFDKLKIDRSFVHNIDIKGTGNGAIVRAIVALAESLGMTTTAEGAETPETLLALKSLGCTNIQGFAYAYPMSASDATLLISAPKEKIESELYPDRKSRLTALKAIQVQTSRGLKAGVLRNVSQGGAMFESTFPFRLGAEVRLQIEELGNPKGTVRWTDGKRKGVAFHREIELGMMQAYESEVAIAQFGTTSEKRKKYG